MALSTCTARNFRLQQLAETMRELQRLSACSRLTFSKLNSFDNFEITLIEANELGLIEPTRIVLEKLYTPLTKFMTVRIILEEEGTFCEHRDIHRATEAKVCGPYIPSIASTARYARVSKLVNT